MNVRAMQIWGFLFNVLGWIFVACTMAMEFWKTASIGGVGGSNIVKVAWYWSSLWRSCFTDSGAISSCFDFPVLWAVEGYIQVVRALLMSALCTGMLAFVLSFLGMECTYIGGKEPRKRKALISGAFFHILSGLLSFAGYVCYAHQVSAEYFNPSFSEEELRFELGTPLFLGWVGSVFEIVGGAFYCSSLRKVVSRKSTPKSGVDVKTEEPESVKAELAGKSRTSRKSKLPLELKAFSKTNVSLAEVSSVSEFHSDSNVSDKESSVASRSGRPGNKKMKTTYL